LREFRKLGFWNRASQREREKKELLGDFAKRFQISSLGPGFYLQTNEKKGITLFTGCTRFSGHPVAFCSRFAKHSGIFG